MKQFHSLVVADKHQETRDSVRISLDVPEGLREEFAFQAGQHLPVQIERDGLCAFGRAPPRRPPRQLAGPTSPAVSP